MHLYVFPPQLQHHVQAVAVFCTLSRTRSGFSSCFSPAPTTWSLKQAHVGRYNCNLSYCHTKCPIYSPQICFSCGKWIISSTYMGNRATR